MTDAAGLPRFFIPREAARGQAPLDAGRCVALPASEAHHAAHVLRLGKGDAVELFDGCGGSARARIARVRRGEVTAVVETIAEPSIRPRPHIHLAFAVPKGRRLTWLLEKATELGAASLAAVRFERSVAGRGDVSAAARRRWLSHCIAAAKQARSAFLPALEGPTTLDEFLASPHAGIYGDSRDTATPLLEAVASVACEAAVHIVVGPEGGLVSSERRALEAGGFAAARLGRTVLRIETAAVALLSAVTALRGG